MSQTHVPSPTVREGATPEGETPELRVLKLDLSAIYSLTPERPACEILSDILKNYRHTGVVLMINASPDVGIEYYSPDTSLVRVGKEIRDLAESGEDWDKVVEKIARIVGSTVVIELSDGYEICTAFTRGVRE